MATSNFDEDYAAAIEPELQDIPVFAKNLEISRRAVWASVAQNEEERKAIAEADENFDYSFTRNGSTFQLVRNKKQELLIEQLAEEGKDIPFTGGEGGLVTHLDGSKTRSNVPVAFQGQPIPKFAWDPMPVTQETNVMLADTVPEMVSSTASNSSVGSQLAKQEVVSNLHLGGNS